MRHLTLIGFTSLTLLAQAVAAETAPAASRTLGTVVVEDTPLPLLGGNRIIPEQGRGVAADGGDLLRQVPGVSGSRLGGKGIDPVIRGQSQTQLNVLIDGAYVHGGCPNRMDPPAAFANIEAYDRVTVLKGVQTLQYGAGGAGGTVLFERGRPQFGPGETYKGKAAASYTSNGDRYALFGDLTAKAGKLDLRLLASRNEAENYEDGNGDEVRTGFEEYGATLVAGYELGYGSRVELSLEATRGDEVLYAGGMDAPQDDNDSIRLKFDRATHHGPFSAISAELYRTDVTHIMDNYSLRDAPMMMGMPMLMSVASDSVTDGGRLSGKLDAMGGQWMLGLDYQGNERSALRYSNRSMAGAAMAPTTLDSLMWPDAEISQMGLFAEGEWFLDHGALLKGGLRYDRVAASADRAAEMPAMGMGRMSANGLYQTYYGATADDHDENNWGGLLRYELEFEQGTWFLGLSRAMRTADATERYMAANNMNPGARWVGNPGLDPEAHNQVELGVSFGRGDWTLGGVAYNNWVSDYILRDTARGQAGILQSDGAAIYRNVDARLSGFELDARWRLNDRWGLSGALAYVRGRNTDENRDLAQIPPLEFTGTLDYQGGPWAVSAILRAAADQTQVDDDPLSGSGLDVGETGGWGVLDLRGSYRLNPQASLDFGLDNVFDKAYAYHLNRANAFEPESVQVNEPGRSVWAKLNLSW